MRLCEAKGRTRGRHRHGVSNQFEGNEPRKRKEICDNDDVREIRGHWYYRPVAARAITVDLTNGHLSPSDLFHPSCFSLFHYLKKPMEWGYNNDAMTYMASPPVKTIPDNKDTFSFCHRRCVESGVSGRRHTSIDIAHQASTSSFFDQSEKTTSKQQQPCRVSKYNQIL